MFRVLNIPWLYFGIAVAIGLIVWRVWKNSIFVLLVVYSFLVITKTVFIRHPYSGNHFQSELFWSWREWEKQKEQILTNVVMFIPIGALGGRLWKWKGLLVSVALSVIIELLQMVSQRGLCEFDDILHNLLGAMIGIGAVMLLRGLVERCKKKGMP